MADLQPIDIAHSLADPSTYEAVILRIFEKRRQRGQASAEVRTGTSYFQTVTGRRSLSKAIAGSVASGRHTPEPVDLWFLESKGKIRAAHMPTFADHVIGSALYQLLSHNARCRGLPGVYSYLPGLTNTTAMRALADFIRTNRSDRGTPLYVLQSDFEHYGDDLPVDPSAPVWPILYEVASLGSRDGAIPERYWRLMCDLVRPVVRDSDGGLFTRRRGVPMGTPLVPLISNLAATPMDGAVLEVDGIFYARYNDDFLLAHWDLAALHDAEARIAASLQGLGVRRKKAKEVRTALSATGMPSVDDPAYRGGNWIDCLGLSVSHAGTMTVGPHRLGRLIRRLCTRVDGAAAALSGLPAAVQAEHLVAATNRMLDVSSPFVIPGLTAMLDATTDRGVLKDVDFRIARKIVQVATGRPGVRGFRDVPLRVLYGEMGLMSLLRLRNLR